MTHRTSPPGNIQGLPTVLVRKVVLRFEFALAFQGVDGFSPSVVIKSGFEHTNKARVGGVSPKFRDELRCVLLERRERRDPHAQWPFPLRRRKHTLLRKRRLTKVPTAKKSRDSTEPSVNVFVRPPLQRIVRWCLPGDERLNAMVKRRSQTFGQPYFRKASLAIMRP